MNEEFYKYVEKIVETVLQNKGLLNGQWHLGTVEQVISPTRLSVFVDGSTVPQTIPCNPKVIFSVGDKVFVLYVNGKSSDKYVPFHRGL